MILVRIPSGQGLDRAICAGHDGVAVLPDDTRARAASHGEIDKTSSLPDMVTALSPLNAALALIAACSAAVNSVPVTVASAPASVS